MLSFDCLVLALMIHEMFREQVYRLCRHHTNEPTGGKTKTEKEGVFLFFVKRILYYTEI